MGLLACMLNIKVTKRAFQTKRKLLFYFGSALRTRSTFCEDVTTIIPRNVSGVINMQVLWQSATHAHNMAPIQDTDFYICRVKWFTTLNIEYARRLPSEKFVMQFPLVQCKC